METSKITTLNVYILMSILKNAASILPIVAQTGRRMLLPKGASLTPRNVLVVAGNFSIDGELVNIAQYDITKKEWSTEYQTDLYLYGESNGVIWDVAVNTSSQPFNKLFVVGKFDTVSETSQIQYCSVGAWDGLDFEKVGEGLCPRGGDQTAMTILTTTLGSGGDIFVGGSFESRVWDGRHFVNVYHVAHFDARKSSWLPLGGGSTSLVSASDPDPKVTALAWDADGQTLYIGGSFGVVTQDSDEPLSTGLAVWSEATGMVPFPGGGLLKDKYGNEGVALCLAFEPNSMSLFVSGAFLSVGDSACPNIAVWHRDTQEWMCLHESSKAFSTITAMMLNDQKLFLSGWAAATADWMGRAWGSSYSIAVLDVSGYISERLPIPGGSPTPSPNQNSTTNTTAATANGTDSNNTNNSSGHKRKGGGGGGESSSSPNGSVNIADWLSSSQQSQTNHRRRTPSRSLSPGGERRRGRQLLSDAASAKETKRASSEANSGYHEHSKRGADRRRHDRRRDYQHDQHVVLPSTRRRHLRERASKNTSIPQSEYHRRRDSSNGIHRGYAGTIPEIAALARRPMGLDDMVGSRGLGEGFANSSSTSGGWLVDFFGSAGELEAWREFSELVKEELDKIAAGDTRNRRALTLPLRLVDRRHLPLEWWQYHHRRLLVDRRNNRQLGEELFPSGSHTGVDSSHTPHGVLRTAVVGKDADGGAASGGVAPQVNVTSNGTRVPTGAPTVPPALPWEPKWQWLPGFYGANGPILRLALGSKSFAGAMFIVGAFNNYPAVVMWYANADKGKEISAIKSTRNLQGLITAISEVYLPFEEMPMPTPPPNTFHQKDYTFFILLSCVMVGVFLGVAFAIGCHSNGYSKVGMDGDDDSSGGELMMGIPLKTLSGGANNAVDFRDCFERAMKARHLPTHESLLIINPKEIVLSRIVGEGSFGRVWSGQWRNNSVAVKEFVFAQAAISGGSLERNNIIEEIVGEAGVMACLRHPKILQLYGCSLTMQAIWIVSEFCSRGSLRMLLNDKSVDLPFLKKISICLDVADGMLYLHTRNPPIIHRDIKSHNLFITEPSPGHFVAKIGDWGSARAVALTGAKSMTHGVGTACWLAPEVINFAHASKDSDVYAFGIVLWEVFTRQEVHEGLSAAQIIAKVANEGLRPTVPRDCPWASIMTECWRQDASERPGFHKIMTSLSKIYSKAKAASKSRGGGGTAGANASLSGARSPVGDDKTAAAGGGAAGTGAVGSGNYSATQRTVSGGGAQKRPGNYLTSPFGGRRDGSKEERTSFKKDMPSYSGTAGDAAAGGGGVGGGGGAVRIEKQPGDEYLTSRAAQPSRILSDPVRQSKIKENVDAFLQKTRSNSLITTSRPEGFNSSTIHPIKEVEESEKSAVHEPSSSANGASAMGLKLPTIPRNASMDENPDPSVVVFKADVDLGDGRLSPVEYILLDTPADSPQTHQKSPQHHQPPSLHLDGYAVIRDRSGVSDVATGSTGSDSPLPTPIFQVSDQYQPIGNTQAQMQAQSSVNKGKRGASSGYTAWSGSSGVSGTVSATGGGSVESIDAQPAVPLTQKLIEGGAHRKFRQSEVEHDGGNNSNNNDNSNNNINSNSGSSSSNSKGKEKEKDKENEDRSKDSTPMSARRSEFPERLEDTDFPPRRASTGSMASSHGLPPRSQVRTAGSSSSGSSSNNSNSSSRVGSGQNTVSSSPASQPSAAAAAAAATTGSMGVASRSGSVHMAPLREESESELSPTEETPTNEQSGKKS